MSIFRLSEVAFDSPDAWSAFQLDHGMAHQAVYEKMLKLGRVPRFTDLFSFPREDNANYLLDHWLVHVSNAELLHLPGIPDLATADLASESTFFDWIKIHEKVHENENLVLGIRQ